MMLRFSRLVHRRVLSSSSSSDSQISANWRKYIGLSDANSSKTSSRSLVPVRYVPSSNFVPSPQVLADLKWLAQKIKLKQDIFLIGPPSRYRSQLVLMMLELLDLEYEYIMLNRDTSESDLKQRKELLTSAMSSIYVDQCVVRAATNGRVLILDGVEKAERNLLPIINNLVENREMHLEDGRFMLPEERYRRLVKDNNTDAKFPIIPIHEDFRVVCIGLPTPPFRGHSLDPPFRSRFQSRRITHWPLRDQFLIAGSNAPTLDPDRLGRWLSFSNAMAAEEIQRKSSQLEAIGGQPGSSTSSNKKPVLSGPPPYFPVDLCLNATAIWKNCPMLSGREMIEFVYPTQLLDAMTPGCSELVKQLANKFDIWEDTHRSKDGLSSLVASIEVTAVKDQPGFAEVTFALPSQDSKFLLPCGSHPSQISNCDFVETPGTRKTLINMLLAHSVADFCLVGARGSGKTANISHFASLLGYGDNVTTVMCFQDMTGRDLLQQRITRADGSTGWEPSPVIRSAMTGGLLILDGVHVLNSSTLLVLKRLVEDREVILPDGSRGLRYDRYESLKASLSFDDKQMKEAGIFRIHPSFRMIAVGEPPTASKTMTAAIGGGKDDSSTQPKTSRYTAPGPWLTPDVNGMFLFVNLPATTKDEEVKILSTLRPNMPATVEKLVNLSSSDASLLSLRQKLRILRLLETYKDQSLYDAVTSASLQRFMSLPARTALGEVLAKSGIKPISSSQKKTLRISIEGDKLTVGDVTTKVYSLPEIEGHSTSDQVDEAMRIPSVLFFDNQRQISSMAEMMKSLLAGEHLLVIGNQGVGKNRIVDRLLELWSRPRHYAQLHRDSTVQSLTVTPSVTGGRLHFEDSPLIKAVRSGHILVLDEADKAPVHVTRVLKGLVESGHMLLPDGRRISKTAQGPDVIRLHPEFRLIVLANPPGYPFLGNNFFASLGDLFSCHVVDNPDFESELELVRNYAGANFDQDLLHRLTASFAELRSKANDGLLPYPYSTRELINVVKHLAAFPRDSVSDALKNVFDFDTWNESALDAATASFGKFGIKLERTDSKEVKQRIARLIELPKPVTIGKLTQTQNLLPKIEMVSSQQLKFDGPKKVETHRIAVDQSDGRLASFTELTRSFQLDLPDHCLIQDATITHQKSLGADLIHVFTTNPALLISFPLRYDTRTGSMIMLDKRIHSPFLKLFPFEESSTSESGTNLLLFDARTGLASTINYLNGTMFDYKQSFAPMRKPNPQTDIKWRGARYISSNLGADRPYALSYRPGEDLISIIDFVAGNINSLKLPFNVRSISAAWSRDASWMIFSDADENVAAAQLDLSTGVGSPITAAMQLYQTSIKELLNRKSGVAPLDEERRVLLSEFDSGVEDYIYSLLKTSKKDGSELEILGVQRDKKLFKMDKNSSDETDKEIREFLTGDLANIAVNDSIYLSNHSLSVSALSSKRRHSVGSYRMLPLASTSNIDSVLEIIHIPPTNNENDKATVSHIPIESSSASRSAIVRLLPTSSQDVVSVMSNGSVRVWEVVQGRIQQSLASWQHRLGLGGPGGADGLEMTISQLLKKKAQEQLMQNKPDFRGPKHGKVDPTNAPHVGGNQWAGGSGGRDTAGMGGAGGPYRLDSGNPITQVPDWVKDGVPEHIKQAAREVAQRTYAERLKQIKMSAFDAELYERYAARVRREVALLRNIIESLPSSKNERVWLKNQSDGDLDESKLIEGLTGEKSVYKRRVEPENEDDRDPSEDKPRLLSLLVDVSGSMARFNSVDLRLEREAAAVLMVMESLASQTAEQKRVIYDIYGHSGESDSLEFCRTDAPPANAKERLDLLQAMQAHTMFCASGDSTISAINRALSRIRRQHADSTAEKFVVLMSDANLSRYGIAPAKLAQAMTPPDLPQDTKVFAIMLGSLGTQAEDLVRALPAGQGYVCMDTADLPRILQQILTTTLLMQD